MISRHDIRIETPHGTKVPEAELRRQRAIHRAFHTDTPCISRHGDRDVYLYKMYSVDTPAKLTAPTLRKLYAGIPKDITCTTPEQLTTMQKKDTIIYTCGQTDTSEAENFIAANGMNAPLHTFTDCPNATATFDYPELQKALFFCSRTRATLIIAHASQIPQDIRALNILEATTVPFRCIDFPWLCRENIRIMKAMALYGKTGNEKK